MKDSDLISAALIVFAAQAIRASTPLDEQAVLTFRTDAAEALAAQKRQRERMAAPVFEWKRSRPPR